MYYQQNGYGLIPYNPMYWNGFPYHQNYNNSSHFIKKQPFQMWPTPYEISKTFPTYYPNQIYNQSSMQPPMYSLFSYFQDKQGNFDLNKMMNTVGQVSNTVKQISPLLKQFSSFFGKVQ